jgi:membrane protease YdiL (CAAX protease family)
MSTLLVNPHATFAASTSSGVSTIPQYTLRKILWVWAAAAIPMGILGWLVGPALARDSQTPGLARIGVLTLGMIWQCVLMLILLYRETGTLRWSTVKARLWLTTPRSPQSGEPNRSLWWWLIPLVIVTAIFELKLSGLVTKFWVSLFPFLAEPEAYALGTFLDTPEARAQMVGAWGTFALFTISALFNSFLGEELLFRGLLLPRMAGRFGKWDWVANALLFGLYHLHQPWGILNSTIKALLFLAFPTRYFRSSWFGVVAHSGQSVYFTILLLGLVLGLA